MLSRRAANTTKSSEGRGFESRFIGVILELAWGPNNLSPGEDLGLD